MAIVAGTFWLLAPRGVPARSLGLVLMLPLFFVLPERPESGDAWLDFLDVGQGMAVAVRTHNHALLYDAGPSWGSGSDNSSSDAARVIVPYFRGEGIDRLDALVVSHDDIDHSGGAASVLQAFPGAMLFSSLASDHPLQARATLRMPCYAGESWVWDGVRFSFLHPTRLEYANPWVAVNDTSCVLKVEAHGGTALLAGDIGRLAEEALLLRELKGLKADVLLVPHHGSAASSTSGFVEAVSPRYAVFSVGYRNRFGHPRADVLERYQVRGSLIQRTDSNGAVMVQLGNLSARGYRQTEPRYWQGL
jgi:competence protein ComEC